MPSTCYDCEVPLPACCFTRPESLARVLASNNRNLQGLCTHASEGTNVCAGSLQIAYNAGGPAAVTYGWLVVSAATTFISLAMAEIVSALPSSGGPYVWAAWMAGRYGPIFSWVTGGCTCTCPRPRTRTCTRRVDGDLTSPHEVVS